MSVLSVIGVVFCVFLGVILLCLAAIWLEKNFPNEKFDERQAVFQGRAWRLSAFAGILYYTVAMIIMINQVEGEKTIEPYLLVFGGILLQSVVYNVYTLFTYSFMEPRKKPWTMVFAYLFQSAVFAYTAKSWLERWPLSFVGKGSSAWAFIFVSATGLFLAMLHLIHLLRREKE